MESARCPGCGAAVRAGVDWCSLCYRDLRPVAQQPSALTAPLVDATVEGGPVRWSELRAWHGEVDSYEADGLPVGSLPTAPVDADPAERLRWPCVCGMTVSFDEVTCPNCGSAFLAELRGDSAGRHRHAATGSFAERWRSSRAFRFIVAGVIALLVAVVIPVLLTLNS